MQSFTELYKASYYFIEFFKPFHNNTIIYEIWTVHTSLQTMHTTLQNVYQHFPQLVKTLQKRNTILHKF